MAQFRRLSNNQIITLSPAPLYAGGEGLIYDCAQYGDLIAKIYKNSTIERARKLSVMTASPPDDPMKSRGHKSIAWPVDLLKTDDDKGEIAGFLMPKIEGARQIFEFYNPQKRRTICPGFDFKYLLRTAKNLVSAISALHDCGYIVGDVNELNILVTNAALVTLIDTDSFQVRDPRSGVIWRCLVGKSDFTPPELQGKNFSNVDRNQQHDLFGLAVINFLLLMEGNHPFNARYLGQGEPMPREERITAGLFPYSMKGPRDYVPPPHAPPYKTLDPVIQYLFRRCFEEGHNNPQARPTIKEWSEGLEQAEQNLVSCSKVPMHHWYGKHLAVCPWCERTMKYKHDPFSPISLKLAGPSNTYQAPLPTLNTKSSNRQMTSRRTVTSQPTRSYSAPLRNQPASSKKPKSVSHLSRGRFVIYLVTAVLMGIIMFVIVSIIGSPGFIP